VETHEIGEVELRGARDAGLISQPVFILGIMQRSGTNYLHDLLCLHPCCLPSEVIFEDFLVAHSDLLVDYARRVYASYPPHWRIEEKIGPSEGLLCQCIGNGLVSFLNSQLLKGAVADQISTGESVSGRSAGSSMMRLITKTPTIRNLQHFFNLFPHSQLLIIVRDGRSVVESGIKSFDWDFEESVHAWASAARTIAQVEPELQPFAGRYMIVRYEDLHSNTERQLTRILSFLGLDTDLYDFELAKNLPVKGSSETRQKEADSVHWVPLEKTESFDPVMRWSSWSPAQHRRFNWLAGDCLKQFGYRQRNFSTNRGLWKLWNHLLDIRWKARARLRRLSLVLNKQ
jgi:hypothetical protein